MSRVAPGRPSWDALYEIAAAQEGYFLTTQAAAAGYSPQLLVHHAHGGRVVRIRRGMYRLVHFPAGEHEDLVVGWLWSERAGIVSHDTALALYNLSDVLPARLHLTLPESWRARRLRVPAGMMLHYADVSEADRQWFGSVPITRVRRTLNDCALDHLSPDLLTQAAHDALRRGLVTLREIAPVARALAPFGKLRGR